MKSPTITANGTERIIPQKPIITAPSNAATKISNELTPSCFSIRIGVIILFWIHWITRKITPTISIPRIPLWIRARTTSGIKARSGQIYGTISSNPVIKESEKMLGISNPKSPKIRSASHVEAATNSDSKSLALSQSESFSYTRSIFSYTFVFLASEAPFATRWIKYFFSREKKTAKVKMIVTWVNIVKKLPIKMNTPEENCFRYNTEESNKVFKLESKADCKPDWFKSSSHQCSRI